MTSSLIVDGSALVAAMKRAGVHQAELGRVVHVTRQHVNDYTKGRRQPSRQTLEAIASALNVKPESLCREPGGGPMYSPHEAADFLGFDVETVRRWLRTGTIRGVQIGRAWRISQDELNRLVREGVAA